ncbi:MFS transporter [Inhella sp.]|uniref:MFS transporter n=1 Tax=Inhella sp. TaxID=1921806 RepID=UPI0035AE7AFD
MTPEAPRSGPAPEAPPRLFANANFRWLLGGGLLSMLGDQFTLIALPWLVLRLTGDPLVLGLVLAVMGLPRAAFILVGGALVDRHSPQRVLLLTKLLNALWVGLLALLVLCGALQLWMVYALALAIGLTTAFSYPAASSILPLSLPAPLLRAANGSLMALRQFSVLIGPLLAGGLIALLAEPGAAGVQDARGLGLAFGFDALSFLVSSWTLRQVRLLSRPQTGGAPVGAAIAEALRHCWNDVELRTLCLYFAAIGFFVGGPIQVALPVLAQQQLPGGAAALGLLLAGHGGGVLVGMALSGLRRRFGLGNLGATVLLIDAIAGCVFLPFGHIHAAWQGVLLLAPLGALAGFVQVAVYTWMQQRVPPAMLGRAMGLFMFLFMGIAPLAAAAAGAGLALWGPQALFTFSGVALLGLVALGLFTPLRRLRDAPAGSPA